MDKKQQVNTIYLTKYRKKKKLSRTSTSEKRNISFGGAALGIRNENHWTVDPKKNKNEKQKLQRARKIPHLMLGVSVLSLFAHSANCNSLCVLLFFVVVFFIRLSMPTPDSNRNDVCHIVICKRHTDQRRFQLYRCINCAFWNAHINHFNVCN